MKRGIMRTVLFAAVLVGITLAGNQAKAGWGHAWGGYGCGPYVGWTGYSYSYYGGWSNWAPSYTYVAHRPRFPLLSRIFHPFRYHHYRYYWGCYDSCWVPSCCTVCGCVWDDCCCGGEVWYDASPSAVPQHSPTPANGGESQMQPPGQQSSQGLRSAVLSVNVPDDARILVNGVETKSTGDFRQYVSRNLSPGYDYTYEVKAERKVGGRTVSESKTVQLRAGQQTHLAFKLPDSQLPSADKLETALTVRVPENAAVYLAGQQTRGTGPVRTFRTTRLAGGQSWSDYEIRVVVEKDGQKFVEREKITLNAGDQREMTFAFDAGKLAAR